MWWHSLASMPFRRPSFENRQLWARGKVCEMTEPSLAMPEMGVCCCARAREGSAETRSRMWRILIGCLGTVEYSFAGFGVPAPEAALGQGHRPRAIAVEQQTF